MIKRTAFVSREELLIANTVLTDTARSAVRLDWDAAKPKVVLVGEIHFAPPKKPWFLMLPLNTNKRSGSPWFLRSYPMVSFRADGFGPSKALGWGSRASDLMLVRAAVGSLARA